MVEEGHATPPASWSATRRRAAVVVGALTVLGLAASAGAPAAARAPVTRVSAKISAAQVRNAKPQGNLARARGTFFETVNVSAARAGWRLTFSGTTGPVRLARVLYNADRSTNAHQLCSPCRSGASGVDHWPRPRFARSYLAAVKRGDAQVILYTAQNRRYGEIAGTLRVVR